VRRKSEGTGPAALRGLPLRFMLMALIACCCLLPGMAQTAETGSSSSQQTSTSASDQSESAAAADSATAESGGSAAEDSTSASDSETGTAAGSASDSTSGAGSAGDSESENSGSVVVPAGDVLPKAYRAENKNPENPFIRFGIIAFGSYPITLTYTNFVWGMVEYVSSGFSSSYIPWPFNLSGTSSITEGEHWERMEVAGYISLGVAVADAIIRIVQEKSLSDAASSAQSELDTEMGGH